MTEPKAFYVYILRCCDGTLYTGYTTDINRRLAAHNHGIGAKYTRTRRPVSLVMHWCLSTKTDALRVEYALKQLSRREKNRLIEARPDSRTLLAELFNDQNPSD